MHLAITFEKYSQDFSHYYCRGINCTHLAITCNKFEDPLRLKVNLNAFVLSVLGELMAYNFTLFCNALKLRTLLECKMVTRTRRSYQTG